MVPWAMSTKRDPAPKFKRWSDMQEGERRSLTEKIKPGFQSELRARRAFAGAGLNSSAHYYIDMDGEKSREIDILAVRRALPDPSRFVHIIVAEVKSGYTWICGDDSPPHRADPSIVRISSPEWFKTLRPASTSKAYSLETDFLDGLNLLAPRFATSMHEVESSKDAKDGLYSGITTVSKAVAGLDFPSSDDPNFYAAVPVLILDGNLLGVVYDDAGDIGLEPRDHIQYRFTFASPGYKKMELYIHIVTMEGLPAFLERIVKADIEASDLASQLCREVHSRKAKNE